ncbi:MAG: FlgD immunoglobulin-like domain containing protein, partial [Balneolaceae bacterium]
NFGETWEKVILPPTTESSLVPEDTYFWTSTFSFFNENTQRSDTATINRYDPRIDNNLLGFSVHIDSQNRVWFGGAAGVNVSHNALTAPTDSISWKHVSFDNSSDGLTGDWIISIQEEPGTGRIWMTNWIASNENESHSIVYTEDEGETFTQMLIGEKVNDIGFKDGYVFAAGVNGLFISSDGGDTWIKSPQIKSANTFIKSSAEFQAVAATTDRIWIGSNDGIASTDNYGQSWEITRVDFPLSGGNVYEPEARNVNSYAYPNPFSASVYEVVRIKFEVEQQGNVNVRIFDFGMNLVREVENNSFSPGTYEAVWDGYDEKGRKVANAPYIYVIETGDDKISGKILVVD